MSLFQSGPYQSRILSSVTRFARRYMDQAAIAVRQLGMTASLGVQVLLYPIYALFQVSRVLGAQVQHTIEFRLPRFRRKTVRNPFSLESRPATLSVDTAIQEALRMVQQFLLPIATPVRIESSPLLPDSQKATADEFHGAWLPPLPLSVIQFRDRVRGLLQTTSPAAEPVPPSPNPLIRFRQRASQLTRQAAGLLYTWIAMAASLMPTQEANHAIADSSDALHGTEESPVFIRGIATLLETRSLVLVTNQNQVLDLLTPEQQEKLRHRIIWQVAHYGRYQKLRLATRQAFLRLQSPSPERPVLPLVRAFHWVMAWMQTSPVAIAVNLFRETSLVIQSTQVPVLPTTTSLTAPMATALPFTASAIAALPFGATLSALMPARSRTIPPESSLQPGMGIGAIALSSSSTATLDSLFPGTITTTNDTSTVTRASRPASTPAPASTTAVNRSPIQPDYIDTQFTLLGYVQTPIETILRWCDRILVWLEDFLVMAWKTIWEWICQLRDRV
jgi:hypothetical protein